MPAVGEGASLCTSEAPNPAVLVLEIENQTKLEVFQVVIIFRMGPRRAYSPVIRSNRYLVRDGRVDGCGHG